MEILRYTKKEDSTFLKKVLVFQKTCFKVQVLKMLKISSDCHTKTWLFFKWGTILKIPRGTKGLSVGFKIKPLRESLFMYSHKNI